MATHKFCDICTRKIPDTGEECPPLTSSTRMRNSRFTIDFNFTFDFTVAIRDNKNELVDSPPDLCETCILTQLHTAAQEAAIKVARGVVVLSDKEQLKLDKEG
jgi:hypothetical protein